MAYVFDGENKLIILSNTDLSIQDLYSRWIDWVAVGDNSKYTPAMRSVGGDAISEVKQLGITFFMTNGWRIRPMEADQRLTVSGNLFTDPAGFSPFINTVGNFNVMIEMSVSSLVDSTVAQLPEIQHGVYENKVVINTVNGTVGTTYPIGTLQYPVKPLADAKTIATEKGFSTFHILGNLTVGATESVSGFTLTGTGVENTKTTLTQGCSTSRTTFRQMTVSGFQDGETHYESCEIKALAGVHCKFDDCLLVGPMKMEEGTFVDTTVLSNCYTGFDKTIAAPALKDEFVVDLHNSSINMIFNNFYGKIKFINLNSATAGTIEVNMGAGKVTIDPSCTAGAIKVRGNGELVDNSGGTSVDNDVTVTLIKAAIQPELDRINLMATASEMAILIQENASISVDGGLTLAQATMLVEIYKLMGLDPTKPLIVTQNSRTAGDVEQSIALNTITKTTVVTRIPTVTPTTGVGYAAVGEAIVG